MGIRNAVGQSGLLTAMAVAIMAWFVVIAFRTFNTMESLWDPTNSVGQTAVSGLIGRGGMRAVLALLFVFFGELGESEPGPEPWTPEEER